MWLLIGAAALFGPMISRLSLFLALRHLEAAMTTLVLFVTPVMAFVLGGLVLGTWPGGLELAGSAVIVVGVALPVAEQVRPARHGR